jgi:hypothetical protein
VSNRLSSRWSRRGVTSVAVATAIAAAVAAPAAAASHANSAQAGRLVASSFAASKAATSVTINGSLTPAGSHQPIVLHITDTKGGGYGSITVDGQTIKLIQVGSVNYFKAGTTYWQKALGSKSSLVVPVYANHWVKSSGPNTPEAGFASVVNLGTFLNGYDTHKVRWVLAGHSTLHGQPVTVVHGTQQGVTGTLLIAAKGPPYLMAIEPPHGNGTVRFSNWNKPVQLTAPSQWVAFSTLGGPTGG